MDEKKRNSIMDAISEDITKNTISQISKRSGVSEPTTRNYVMVLEAKGELQVSHVGKTCLYRKAAKTDTVSDEASPAPASDKDTGYPF